MWGGWLAIMWRGLIAVVRLALFSFLSLGVQQLVAADTTVTNVRK